MSALLKNLIVIIFLFCSCSLNNSKEPFKNSLANQGILSLSANNPYVASNLFLASEIKKNPVLQGFIEKRGTPDALEIKKEFFQPHQVNLYYLDQNELYQIKNDKENYLIIGPYKLSPEDLTAFANLSPLKTQSPLLEERKPSPTKANEEIALIENNSDSNRASEKIAQKQSSRATLDKNSKAFNKQNDLYKNSLEDSINSDIMHTVNYNGENLKLIAQWYTGDTNNAARIARINNINNNSTLQLNKIIRIPRYLVKNINPLPKEEVEKAINK